MRADWDRRAEEDYKLHIATGHAASDEAFQLSGRHDLDEAILDGLIVSPEAEALEIGCGVGRLLVPLSERVAAAGGVDISTAMIERSRVYTAGRPNVTTYVTDGTLASFADDSLDLVFSFIVFQHIPERAPIETYVREAARVLRPGGLLRFQVDGRHHLTARAGWAPDTYDGYKFSPREVRELLAHTPLEVVDEWGEESHYHWVTARKGVAASPRVGLRSRHLQRTALAEIFLRARLTEVERLVEEVVSRRRSLKEALAPWQEELGPLPDEELVREIYRVLLGWPPDPAGLAFHLAVLQDPKERATIADTVLTSKAFRDLVCPFVPDVAWSRWEAAREALDGEPSSFLELAGALATRLRALPAGQAVREGFVAILGHPPDEAAAAFHTRVVGAGEAALGFFVRGLLATPDPRPVPKAPPSERLAALAARSGVVPDGGGGRGPGESFPGEAAVARRLLDRCRGEGERAFVRAAYEAILGREADPEGEAFYAGKLEGREMNRAAFLRDLLWSEELRGA